MNLYEKLSYMLKQEDTELSFEYDEFKGYQPDSEEN